MHIRKGVWSIGEVKAEHESTEGRKIKAGTGEMGTRDDKGRFARGQFLKLN